MRWEVVTHSGKFEKMIPFQRNQDVAFDMLHLILVLMLIKRKGFMVTVAFCEIT